MTRVRQLGVPLVLAALLVVVPQLPLDIPVVFNGSLDSPGTLGLLALCLLFAGVALTYDLLFGFTGLLSFGHALYFALGVYLTTIALTKWEWSLWQAVAVTAIAGILVPLLLGAISLRVGGIAFAMVTLAFAQAGQVLVQKNPDQLTGGEEGLGLNSDPLPDFFVGVLNAKNLYWLALGYAIVVFLVVRFAVSSSPGHVWQAIRENERRVEVIGLRPFGFKLIAFVLASFLCTLGGIVWLLVLGTGASPQVTTANFTLTLLVMVVIGGAGTRYGALLGGFLYTLLDQRLGSLAGSSQVQDLPTIIRKPLSEPLFILGTLFILLVFFVPGGLAGLGRRVRLLRRSAGLEGAMKIAWERHGKGPSLLLIHGLGYARWGWEPVVEPLSQSFDVILFDNRGVGESDAPAGPYTAAQMAGDAIQVLDEAGVERAHVVGTSLGGMVAQELALTHPERVDTLVLACTTPGGPNAFPMPQRTVELMQARATLRQFTENALEPDPRPELVDRILVHRERTAQPFEQWASQAAAGATFDAHSRLGSLAMPTLVQTGDGDLVVDPRNSDLLVEAIPDARLSVYPGAGHVFMWQEPDGFVAELEDFLC